MPYLSHKQLRLGVIQDQGVLEIASDNRLGEEFSAYIRGLNFHNSDSDDDYTGRRLVTALVAHMPLIAWGPRIVLDEANMRSYHF